MRRIIKFSCLLCIFVVLQIPSLKGFSAAANVHTSGAEAAPICQTGELLQPRSGRSWAAKWHVPCANKESREESNGKIILNQVNVLAQIQRHPFSEEVQLSKIPTCLRVLGFALI